MVSMNFINFKLCIVVCIVIIDLSQAKSLVKPNLQTTQPTGAAVITTKRSYSCSCDDNSEPVCANNGVTYKNMCRFECASHKIDKLRVVKEGDCGKYLSKLQFWSFGK